MDLKKEITEMIYKNSHDTSEGVLIDFKVITPLIENIVAIAVTHCCKSDSEQLVCDNCKYIAIYEDYEISYLECLKCGKTKAY
jgi:hypothetical protein